MFWLLYSSADTVYDKLEPKLTAYTKAQDFLAEMAQGYLGFSIMHPSVTYTSEDEHNFEQQFEIFGYNMPYPLNSLLNYLFSGKKQDCEQWVILASAKEITHPYDVDFLAQHIEMSMMVTTSLKANFSIHMGISRTAQTFFFDEIHSNISWDMHAFASKIVQDHYADKPEAIEKTFMIHAPTPYMRDLLKKGLGEKYREATAEEDNAAYDAYFPRMYPSFYKTSLRQSCDLKDLIGSNAIDIKTHVFEERERSKHLSLDPYYGLENLELSQRIIDKYSEPAKAVPQQYIPSELADAREALVGDAIGEFKGSSDS